MCKEILKDLLKEKETYYEMIKFCCDNYILNNNIVNELEMTGYYFSPYCGHLNRNDEIYQYYIIDENDAERLSEYTNEYVIYNENLALYVLCVTHLGTPWTGMDANWKNLEEFDNE